MKVWVGSHKQSRHLMVVLMAGFLIACQPPAIDERAPVADNEDTADAPISIDADSVTMAQSDILSLKSSRYQPSLGLQGTIEPIRQAQFSAAQDLLVKEVLVSKGQWVKKGTPLLLIQRQTAKLNREANATDHTDDAQESNDDQPTTAPVSNQTAPAHNTSTSRSIATTTTQTAPQTSHNSATDSSDQPEVVVVSEIDPENGDTIAGTVISDNTTPKTRIQAAPITSAAGDKEDELLTIRASFSGRINDVYVTADQQVSARKPLLHLGDDTDLRFVATVPIQAKSQLSIGQTVNFTAEPLSEKFTGQISQLLTAERADQLSVYVHVIKKEGTKSLLKPDMAVTGRVNYGQIEVGTTVPERGLHDVDLSPLQQPPYQPLSPLTANVWIIKQDQRLTRQPVEVIEYDPITRQYLIAGISNDSLICLADLPIESAGKKVVIS